MRKEYQAYFEKTAEFLLQIEENRQWILAGNLRNASIDELESRNYKLYQDIISENYENSFANPKTATELFGKETGQFLAALYAELRSLIPAAYENDVETIVIRMELFLEVYGMFLDAAEESKVPDFASLKEAYFWFACDYIEEILEKEVTAQFDPEGNWAGKMLDGTDVSDLRYSIISSLENYEEEIISLKINYTINVSRTCYTY